jgi:hypothetical protein
MYEPPRAAAATVLARFRPTGRQALGHGLGLGALAAAGMALVLLAATGAPRVVDWLTEGPPRFRVRLPVELWLGGIGAALLIGVLVGLSTTRHGGVDADDLGIHRVPPMPRSFAPWQRIVEIQAERRRGRTVVAVWLDSGEVLRLWAPFDGRGLSRDHEFEQKLFTLRNLWETHRSWEAHP